jgi:hypothetical protein
MDTDVETNLIRAIELMTARSAVQETMLMQMMLRLAGLFDHPEEFVRQVMVHSEASLVSGLDIARQSSEQEAIVAEAAVDYFNDLSNRLIHAMSGPLTKN